MNTTSVQINTQLYNTAVEYARRQHTSVEKMLEGFILSLPIYGKTEERPRLKRPTNFSPELLKLSGILKQPSREEDLNGDDARWEYLKEKFCLE